MLAILVISMSTSPSLCSISTEVYSLEMSFLPIPCYEPLSYISSRLLSRMLVSIRWHLTVRLIGFHLLPLKSPRSYHNPILYSWICSALRRWPISRLFRCCELWTFAILVHSWWSNIHCLWGHFWLCISRPLLNAQQLDHKQHLDPLQRKPQEQNDDHSTISYNRLAREIY